MGIEHDWTLLPAVVVRSAGFGWEIALSLLYPRAAELAAAVVRLERQALDLLAEAPDRGTDVRPSGAPNGRADTGRVGSGRMSSGREDGGRLPRGLRGRLRDLRPLPPGTPLPPETPAPAGWVAAWNEVTGLLEEARLTLAGTVTADAALARAAMAGIVTDERFLDALVSASPALYRDLRRGTRADKLRREIAHHVQRLSASCETAGSHGPIGYGVVGSGQACGHTWKGHREYARRLAFPAARVGEALQQRILADPELVAGLVPRRKTWTGEVQEGAGFTGHCDGVRTLAEIAAETGTGMERASAALAVAVRRGLLTHDLCPPDTIGDTLGWLRERLAARGTPEHGGMGLAGAPGGGHGGAAEPGARRAMESCECGFGRAAAFPHDLADGAGREVAGAAEKPGCELAHARERGSGPGLSASAGIPAQRRRPRTGARPGERPPPDAALPLARRVAEISDLLGQYPAASPDVKLAVQRRIEALAGGGRRDERAIVHEAAAGTLRVTAGGALADDLRGRVPRVLGLLAAEAELTRLRTNRLLAGRLGPGTYELAEVLRTTGDLRVEHGDRLAGRIAALIRDAPQGTSVLNLAGLLDEPAPPAAPVLCSADVMVAARSLEAYEQGVTPLVLGRLHDTVQLTPWALQFHEEAAACLAERDTEVRRALSGFTVLNVISRRSDGVPPLELPGPVLELGGVAADPLRRRIGLDELYVHSDGRRAVLHAKGMDEPLLFHNGEHDTAVHTALALPRIEAPRLDDLARVPRLTWDNVVISAGLWRVGRPSFEALGQATGDRELLVAIARLRESHGLPVAFFASSPREREPFYVDTRSPALLEGLARLASTAEQISMTEVLPGPRDCWLRDGEQRFAAELRCVYLRAAGGGHADDHPEGPCPERAAALVPAAGRTTWTGGARPRGVTTGAGTRSRDHLRAAHPYPWPGEGG